MAEWRELRLGDVVELQRGFDLPSRERTPGVVPIVSSGGVTGTHGEARVQGPGVVTGRYGTLGGVFFVDEPFWPLNTTLFVKDFKGNDPLFVSYLLRTVDFLAYSDKAAVPGINRNHLHEARVSVPPLEEQRRIAGILGALDDKIELNRRASDTLEAMARVLFRSWFVDFDPVRAKAEGRDPGLPPHLTDPFPDRFVDSELGEIPVGWRAGSIADLALLGAERLSAASLPEVVQYVDLAGTKSGRINEVTSYARSEAPSRAQHVLRRGDTIVGTVRPGNRSFARIPHDGLIGSSGFAHLRPRRASDSAVVYLAATDDASIDALDHLADGAAYPAVRPQVVALTPVAIPAPEVLDAFADLAAPLLDRSSAQASESSSLAAIRDTLLPRLLSGDLEVSA